MARTKLTAEKFLCLLVLLVHLGLLKYKIYVNSNI